MAINKSLEVTHIGFPLIYLNTVFSQTIRPIYLKFHKNTHFDKVAKIYANCSGHMPKMADMPINIPKIEFIAYIYILLFLNIFSRTR